MPCSACRSTSVRIPLQGSVIARDQLLADQQAGQPSFRSWPWMTQSQEPGSSAEALSRWDTPPGLDVGASAAASGTSPGQQAAVGGGISSLMDLQGMFPKNE